MTLRYEKRTVDLIFNLKNITQTNIWEKFHEKIEKD